MIARRHLFYWQVHRDCASNEVTLPLHSHKLQVRDIFVGFKTLSPMVPLGGQDLLCVTSLCPQVNFSVHNHFLPGPCIIIENLISFRLTGIICQSNADLSRTKNIAAKDFLTEDEFLTTTFGQYLYSTDRHYKIIAFNWSCEIFAFHRNALFFATNV